jgi:DnaJ-class molecular chaperone
VVGLQSSAIPVVCSAVGYTDRERLILAATDYVKESLYLAETHYDTLGITPEATPSEIAEAYRLQSLKWHPDKNSGSAESEEKFKRIDHAYAVLRDPAARATYDASLGGAADAVAHSEAPARLAAAQRLLEEAKAFAARLASQGFAESYISTALQAKGLPQDIAASISRMVDAIRRGRPQSAAERPRGTEELLWNPRPRLKNGGRRGGRK